VALPCSTRDIGWRLNVWIASCPQCMCPHVQCMCMCPQCNAVLCRHPDNPAPCVQPQHTCDQVYMSLVTHHHTCRAVTRADSTSRAAPSSWTTGDRDKLPLCHREASRIIISWKYKRARRDKKWYWSPYGTVSRTSAVSRYNMMYVYKGSVCEGVHQGQEQSSSPAEV
jgi:hypothetical protein